MAADPTERPATSSRRPGLVPDVVDEPEQLTRLRHEVRAFITDQISSGAFVPVVDGWLTAWDPTFSRALAERHWIGMTIPRAYGGHGRSFMERFVVTEELLAAGAPVAAHWIADRQIAPSLLRSGTEDQKHRFLPRIAQGDCFFGIGMSEPDAGSDLASVRTRADRVDGGWRVRGTKVWTSGAHRAEAFFVLARTEPADPANRHGGLTQFIVDLRSPGVQVKPIVSMSGLAHFNEVHLDDVFVPDELVLGRPGSGWAQVTSELGFERSGPERFLSSFPLLTAVVREVASGELPAVPDLGRMVARLAALHQMSMAVSWALEHGGRADVSAAVVKLLGTTAEGRVVELADRLGAQTLRPSSGPPVDELTRQALMSRPGFTLRGGANEILHGVIARGLGMR